VSESGESRTQKLRRNVIAGGIVALLAVGAAIGIPVTVNASNAAHAEQLAEISDATDATLVTRAAAQQQTMSAGSAVEAKKIADQEAAAAKAAAEKAAAEKAAQEKAAAEAAAQKAAQEAAAQAAQEQAASDDSGSNDSGGDSSASGAPSGTPLPMQQVTDPNNAQYGQMVPSVDPASWCANHSASTINGVPTCD
jgi:membrane protein involved in colicin uptake